MEVIIGTMYPLDTIRSLGKLIESRDEDALRKVKSTFDSMSDVGNKWDCAHHRDALTLIVTASRANMVEVLQYLVEKFCPRDFADREYLKDAPYPYRGYEKGNLAKNCMYYAVKNRSLDAADAILELADNSQELKSFYFDNLCNVLSTAKFVSHKMKHLVDTGIVLVKKDHWGDVIDERTVQSGESFTCGNDFYLWDDATNRFYGETALFRILEMRGLFGDEIRGKLIRARDYGESLGIDFEHLS